MLDRTKHRRWSDDQRRLACRLLFIALVLVPGLSVAWFAARPVSPGEISDALRLRTGIEISIGSVGTPRPGELILQAVTLPGPAGPLAEIGGMQVLLGEETGLHVAGTVRMEVGQFTALAEKFCTAALPATKSQLASAKPFHLRFERILLASSQSPDARPEELILAPVECVFAKNTERSVAVIRFRQAGQSAEQVVELAYERRLAGGGHEDWLRLDSCGAELPLWLAEGFCPWTRSLGSQSCFAGGLLWKIEKGRAVQGTLQGTLTDLDLAGLSQVLPLGLQGSALQIGFQSSFEAGKLVTLEAESWSQIENPTPATVAFLEGMGWEVAGVASAAGSNQPTGPKSWNMALNCRLQSGQFDCWPRPEYGSVIAWDSSLVPVVQTVGSVQTRVPLEQLATCLFRSASGGTALSGNRVAVPSGAINDREVAFLSLFQLQDGPAAIPHGSREEPAVGPDGSPSPVRIASEHDPAVNR